MNSLAGLAPMDQRVRWPMELEACLLWPIQQERSPRNMLTTRLAEQRAAAYRAPILLSSLDGRTTGRDFTIIAIGIIRRCYNGSSAKTQSGLWVESIFMDT